MTYQIFDSETQTNKIYKRVANPWHPDNYVVLRGWKKQGDKRASAERFTGKTPDNFLRIDDDVDILVGHNIKFDLLYEMCNQSPSLAAFFKRGGKIWCTQYAEYLLEGQDQKSQMVAMDTIAESYGGRVKVDGIKELWNAGVQTADIDHDLLLDYLIGTEEEGRNSGDIGNTEKIYLGQLKAAEDLGMLAAIQLRMDGLACTTEMEFNGLKIDVKKAGQNLKQLTAELEEATADLAGYTKEIPDEVGFNWGSNVHKSCILFGGTIKYKKQTTYIDEATGELARLKAKAAWPLFLGKPVEPCDWRKQFSNTGELFVRVRWDEVQEMHVIDTKSNGAVKLAVRGQDVVKSGPKTGMPKTKQMTVQGELKVKYQEFFHELPGYTEPNGDWAGEMLDGMNNPVYSTSAEIIELITKRDIPFLKALGRFTNLNKDIGTYYVRWDVKKKEYVGMLTCVDPATHIVHHSLNHSSTVTTRLTSNNPNLQNVPTGRKSNVKGIFVSRFGDDGAMLEEDYSQLEVVVQGLLTGDKNLIRDLVNKIDFHCKRVSVKFDIKYEDAIKWCKDELFKDYTLWKDRRQGVKEFSFQRAYGAGAAGISDSTGMPVDDVRTLIELEDKMYPDINRFNNRVAAEVEGSSEPFRDGARGWRVFRRGQWQAPTGTIYKWRSYDAPSWLRNKGVTDTFKPTEMKNYPVQGTGGEIVQMILGLLWRWFIKMDNFGGKAFLVNTVHDCVWIDCHKDVLDVVAAGVKAIMQAVPQVLKKYFGVDCPVPFPVEAESGPNMLDLHHWAPTGERHE